MKKIIIGIIVIIIAIVVINAANDAETNQCQEECCSKCTWFQERVCETDERIGWCFFSWGCGDQHPCGDID